MGNWLMEAVRSALGLSRPAEYIRIDRRFEDREQRLRAIDARIDVDFPSERAAGFRRRASDR